MMNLTAVFWMFLILFGVIGGFRGWAKEILVVFSMVLALFISYVLEKWVPGVRDAINAQTGGTQVAIRGTLLLILAYFGYQTPGLPASVTSKLAKDKLQDWMLGAVLGMINGYFIIGSLWYYLHVAGYPLPYVTPPTDPNVLRYITYLPPK
ncbi:MAG: CvpA family protein, partial [Chloroflexi bacterium]|nr:CvpA family protein [Chloroflexota bacterium]